MDDSVRLFCPECELVYRVKTLKPGKNYKCRKCGCSLRGMDSAGAGDRSVPAPHVPDFESGIARENLAAASSTRRVLGPGARGDGDSPASEALLRLEGQVSRLSGLIDSFLEKRGEPVGAAVPGVEIDRLRDELRGALGGVEGGLSELGGKLGGMDVLNRMIEDLIREQVAGSTRLETLASETKHAFASLAKLDEWRGDLPVQVADEIGRTVEERVVGPISGALARQAPAILSDMQDNRLVDVVSRSVREAQRPLLREILAGSRGGVPLWLFASILLPFLLILGYLFLPGEFGFGDGGSANAIESISGTLTRMETDGVLLAPDADGALRNVEAVVLDMHAQAMTHAKNAAALEEEAKSLKAALAERDGLIKDYTETLQKQVRRLRAYEMTLTRLGVSPESVPE